MAADATIIIEADHSKLQRSLQEASSAIGGFLREAQTSVSSAAGAAASFLDTLKSNVLGAVGEFSAVGDQFDKMSQRTGISTSALSEYAHAAQMCGSDVQSVEAALKGMASQLVQAQSGSARAAANFERLGVNVDEFAKLSPERQFDKLAAAIAEIDDPTERAGAALKIFGSAGQQLLPLFTSGSEGLAAMREEARKLGVSVDESTAKLGAEYEDAMTRVKQSLFGVKAALAKEFAPALVDAANRAAELLAKLRAWISEHPELTRAIVTASGALAAGAVTIKVYASALSLAQKTVSTFGAIAGTNPVVLALAGITAAAVAGTAAFNEYDKRKNEAINGGGWSDAARQALEDGDRLREQDLERFERLKELAKQEKLSSNEIAEAVRLAAELKSRYGDVGVEVDATAGKIRMADDAQRKMNAAMLEARRKQLEAALAEAKHNAKENVVKEKVFNEKYGAVKKAQANAAARISNARNSNGPRLTGMDVLMNSEVLGDSNEARELVRIEQDKANAELKILEEMLDALGKPQPESEPQPEPEPPRATAEDGPASAAGADFVPDADFDESADAVAEIAAAGEPPEDAGPVDSYELVPPVPDSDFGARMPSDERLGAETRKLDAAGEKLLLAADSLTAAVGELRGLSVVSAAVEQTVSRASSQSSDTDRGGVQVEIDRDAGEAVASSIDRAIRASSERAVSVSGQLAKALGPTLAVERAALSEARAQTNLLRRIAQSSKSKGAVFT